MSTMQAIWLGLGVGLLGFVSIAWLKGAFSLVGAVGRKLAHEGGEPWTLGAFAEPFGAFVVVLVTAVFGVAHPESRWARWFYGPTRMVKARECHDRHDVVERHTTSERNEGRREVS